MKTRSSLVAQPPDTLTEIPAQSSRQNLRATTLAQRPNGPLPRDSERRSQSPAPRQQGAPELTSASSVFSATMDGAHVGSSSQSVRQGKRKVDDRASTIDRRPNKLRKPDPLAESVVRNVTINDIPNELLGPILHTLDPEVQMGLFFNHRLYDALSNKPQIVGRAAVQRFSSINDPWGQRRRPTLISLREFIKRMERNIPSDQLALPLLELRTKSKAFQPATAKAVALAITSALAKLPENEKQVSDEQRTSDFRVNKEVLAQYDLKVAPASGSTPLSRRIAEENRSERFESCLKLAAFLSDERPHGIANLRDLVVAPDQRMQLAVDSYLLLGALPKNLFEDLCNLVTDLRRCLQADNLAPGNSEQP